MHAVDSGWTFNGDYEKPTFSPSVLVTSGHYLSTHKKGDPCWCTFKKDHPDCRFVCTRCHSFVKAGQIQFLADSSHALAGKTVALTPFLSNGDTT
jgi:hypothetical protein